MRKNNKKILLGIILLLVVMTSVFLITNRKEEYKELPKVKIKNDNINNSLAIMVESNYQTEEYTKWEDNSFPTNGYTLNRIKSGCIDNNGQNVDALTYNEETKKISLKAQGSVKCYLYYDSLFKGKGTKEEPYEINYIEDLVRLSNSVNKDSNNYNSKYFILKRNLDFNTNESYMKYNDTGFEDINGVSGIEGIKDELTNQNGSGFIPIGLEKSFEGNIDGKNYKISNLWIYNTKNEDQKLAFIGRLTNGSISNLTITGEVKTIGGTPLGGLVNRIANSTIDNCTNEVNVTSNNGSYAVGGLVGWSDGTATIKNSTNKGNVTNGGQTGGIISSNQGGTLTIENCKNYGKIENNLGTSLGGIVGASAISNPVKTIITNSGNYGEIKVNSEVDSVIYAGGIIGLSNKELEITNSHNESIINVNGINDLNIGGIIGRSENKTTITNSYNLGKITSSTSGNFINEVGGIVGNITYNDITKTSKIESSYNKGNITGGNRTGGIVGYISNNLKLIINKCYNIGNLTGQEDTIYTSSVQLGGILGQAWNGPTVYILNSYNIGELIANAKNTGGHAGGIAYIFENSDNASSGYIINSYNRGKITSKTTGIGISRINITSVLSLNNVYNIGEVNSPNKAEIAYVNTTGAIKSIDNAYYKEGLVASNTSLTGIYPITDANMKNPDGNDSNSLLYKLNQNVQNLNSAGLSSIDSETIGTDLDGYTLSSWKIDSTTGYPTLDYNLETE